MSGQPAKSLWDSFLDDDATHGRNFVEQLEYWIGQLDEFEKNPAAAATARDAAPQNFCKNCLRLAKRLLFLESRRFPEEPCKHALQSLEDFDKSSDRHLQEFCDKRHGESDSDSNFLKELGNDLIVFHGDEIIDVFCPASKQSRKARTYRLAAALCSTVQMLDPSGATHPEAAYFGALAEFRLGFVSSARERVGSNRDDHSEILWNNLNLFLKLKVKEDCVAGARQNLTLDLSVSALSGFTSEKYPGTFRDIVQSLFDRSGNADHACVWNPSILKERFPVLKDTKSNKKISIILRNCVRLMEMPSEFASRQFLRKELKELDLQSNYRPIACIGSWNIMCSNDFHHPNDTFELKMKSVLELVSSQNWGIVALQELPGSTVKLRGSDERWQARTIEEKIMKIIRDRGDSEMQSFTAQKSSDWQWRGLTVGKPKNSEHGGFLFNSRLWKIEEEIKQFEPEDLEFTRPPILAVFTSVEAPRIILAIASVHLKAHDSDGLTKTQTEAAQLGRVADELTIMAERFRQEATTNIYAIVGDFNLSPISGDDPFTTPTIQITGESAFKSLEDKGFEHLVKGQATNAIEFMIAASEGHCFDNCFVKVESPAFDILPSYVLAQYPNHLPSIEDWNTAIDNAVRAVPEGKFQETMKDLVKKGLTEKRKEYMVDKNTSDHRAITIRFKQGVGPPESSEAAVCAACPVSPHGAPPATPFTLMKPQPPDTLTDLKPHQLFVDDFKP